MINQLRARNGRTFAMNSFRLVALGCLCIISGCGGVGPEEGGLQPITAQDAGTWSGSLSGYIAVNSNYPQSQAQTSDAVVTIDAGTAVSGNLKVTTYEAGSGYTRVEVLPAIAPFLVSAAVMVWTPPRDSAS